MLTSLYDRGMDSFQQLRQRAAEKRDYAFKLARRIYQHDLAAIEALECALPATIDAEPVDDAPQVPNTMGLIQSLIPPDKPFTVADLMGWLRAAQPGQTFHEPTVRTYVSRLASRGAVKRLYKTGHKYTLWIVNAEHEAIDTKPLADIVGEILFEADRPLKTVEIAAALQQRGYRADAKPVTLVRAVRDLIKRYPKRFQRGSDGRWAVVDLP